MNIRIFGDFHFSPDILLVVLLRALLPPGQISSRLDVLVSFDSEKAHIEYQGRAGLRSEYCAGLPSRRKTEAMQTRKQGEQRILSYITIVMLGDSIFAILLSSLHIRRSFRIQNICLLSPAPSISDGKDTGTMIIPSPASTAP